MKCRICSTELEHTFVDLATAPPSNAYLTTPDLAAPERYFPLRVLVCSTCWLVQTEDYADASQLFGADYAYFSSFSQSWLAHSARYVNAMKERFGLNAKSMVVEVAANDGYLLQYVKTHDIPCYGIEPTASTAAAARNRGIDIVESFFGERTGGELAAAGRQADLMVANNVLAHVPDLHDFVRGFARLLKPSGVATFEFPHLQRLVEMSQFDTIYHEHYSYLSLGVACRILETNGLEVFDVEELDTHGGSLRLFAQHRESGVHPVGKAVDRVRSAELRAGMNAPDFYLGFQEKAERIKDDFLAYLIECRRAGLSVAAYGAAAKGSTLLNYAGVHADLVSFVVDKNPSKQGKFLPGSRIPIVDVGALDAERPNRIIILPWNLVDEIIPQIAHARDWGARFVRAVPRLEEIA